mmetsp:Transcript_26424/g.71376  ORF Transcript_26424/g.71376 Transcript_26424/m.71376 type:complete len:448 (-) Transcript_26424:313-1656(-)
MMPDALMPGLSFAKLRLTPVLPNTADMSGRHVTRRRPYHRCWPHLLPHTMAPGRNSQDDDNCHRSRPLSRREQGRGREARAAARLHVSPSLLVAREHDVAEVDQGVLAGRVLEDVQRTHGLVRVILCEEARPLQPLGFEEELVRCLQVSALLELALDQARELRELVGRVQDRRGGEPEGHVLQFGLAERVRTPREVKHVIHDLERETEVVTVVVSRACHVTVERVPSQERGALARVGDERRGLVERFLDVELHLHALLRRGLDLHDLTLHQGLEGASHCLNYVNVTQTCHHQGSAREQVVTGEHSHRVGVGLVHCRAATPRVRLVEHVVMDETSCVDHLRDLREAVLLIKRVLTRRHLARVAGDAWHGRKGRVGVVPRRIRVDDAHGPGHEQHNGGPELLARLPVKEVLGCHVEHSVVRFQQLLDGAGEGLDVRAHQLEGVDSSLPR